MKTRRKGIVLVALGTLAVMLLAIGWLGHGGAEESRKAKEFNLSDLNQKKFKLSDFKGKVVLLNFFATWCPPCQAEIPDLIKIHKQYKEKGLAVVGISLDTDGLPRVLSSFIKEMKIPYPVLLGTKEVIEQYRISGVPTSYILTREGKVFRQYQGLVPYSYLEDDLKKLL